MKLHSLAVLLAFVAAIAIKGFVVGATGLLISKLIGLKLLLQKRDDEKEEDSEDHQEENDGEAEKPIVVYLNSNQKWAKNGYEGHSTFKERFYPYARNWEKYENIRKRKWADLPNWRQQRWR